MTDKMLQAGIDSLLSSRNREPEAVVDAIWQAINDAKQKESLQKYRESYE